MLKQRRYIGVNLRRAWGESTLHTFPDIAKYDFLFPAELQNFEQTKRQLEFAVSEYNDKPYLPLHRLTPNEVFDGNLPDKAMFKNEIIESKKQRIVENRKDIYSIHK